jgi:neurobeachin-like protein 1/2
MCEKDELGLPDMVEIVKNESEPTLEQNDLMVFDEENMEMQAGDLLKHYNNNNNNNMLSEAANVIEHEIKELADSISGAVADNFSSVYSVIKQKTCDFQDTIEHFAMGSFEDSIAVSRLTLF